MDVERSSSQLKITLTQEEVFRIQEGKVVGNRGGFIPDSMVEVFPLGHFIPDDSNEDRWTSARLDKAQTTPLFAQLLANQDLQIGIPEIVLSDVRISGRTIQKANIQTPNEGMRETLPEEGIRINFGGSLRIVDLYPSLVS